MATERPFRVELGAAGRIRLHHDDLLDRRAVEGEELLDAHAIRVARNGEVRGRLTTVIDCENLALEILKARLAVAFLDADGDANRVPRVELRELLIGKLRRLFRVDLVQNCDTHGDLDLSISPSSLASWPCAHGAA